MNLILVRHAIAEDREEFAKTGREDHLRPLTAKGRRRMEKMAEKIRESIEDVDLIVTSPYVRAKDTAKILQEYFHGTTIVEAPELVPQSPNSAFLQWLKAHAGHRKCIMAVGHEPHMSSFLTFLISGQQDSIVKMKKSAMANLEVEDFQGLAPGGAILKWLVQPKLMID